MNMWKFLFSVIVTFPLFTNAESHFLAFERTFATGRASCTELRVKGSSLSEKDVTINGHPGGGSLMAEETSGNPKKLMMIPTKDKPIELLIETEVFGNMYRSYRIKNSSGERVGTIVATIDIGEQATLESKVSTNNSFYTPIKNITVYFDDRYEVPDQIQCENIENLSDLKLVNEKCFHLSSDNATPFCLDTFDGIVEPDKREVIKNQEIKGMARGVEIGSESPPTAQ